MELISHDATQALLSVSERGGKRAPGKVQYPSVMKRFMYSQTHHQLELDGSPLHCGEALEVRILGSWVFGVLAHDQSGWYLITQEQSEIRLQAGLVGRVAPVSPPSSSSHLSSSQNN